MSGRKRFFVEDIASGTAVLEGEEFSHALVQRVEVGTEIILLDGSGREYSAIVARLDKHSLTAHIVREYEGGCEPATEIYLLCGALKGDKTELVVQKACELGVSRVGIFSSAYCSAYMNANKIERLKRVAREAAKQCMRSRAPEILYFDGLTEALSSAQSFKNKLFACEFADRSQADLSALCGPTALVVGSEGGFSEEEAKSASELGFSLITLGKRILRAETAAVALTAVAAFSLGELK